MNNRPAEFFLTRRLAVYSCIIHNPNRLSPRHVGKGFAYTVWLGYERGNDYPSPTTIISTGPRFGPEFANAFPVEWVETMQPQRRQGYAKEMWIGLEKFLEVPLVSPAVTDEGRALLRSLGRVAAKRPGDGDEDQYLIPDTLQSLRQVHKAIEARRQPVYVNERRVSTPSIPQAVTKNPGSACVKCGVPVHYGVSFCLRCIMQNFLSPK